MREELLRRLKELNGGGLAEEPPVQAEPPVASEKRIPLHKLRDRVQKNIEWRQWDSAPDEEIPLDGPSCHPDDLLLGHETHGVHGVYYRIDSSIEVSLPETIDLGDRFRGFWDAPSPRCRDLVRLKKSDPERLLFFDIETTGLSDCPVFLIGMMRLENTNFRVRQLLARRPGEERAIVGEVWNELSSCEARISFNGKSFDQPFLLQRAVHHHLAVEDAGTHIDLLPPARRKWKDRLPNCRLQTLEFHLCGRERVGDIPSHRIPATYRRFVETGDARLLLPVLSHNVLDMVSMAEIILHLARE